MSVKPAIYSFPPFWTKQRNETTGASLCLSPFCLALFGLVFEGRGRAEKQRKEDWVLWIIGYTKEKRITELIVEKELKVCFFAFLLFALF